MGATNSKTEKDEALRLCKERRRFIKQAIDSRYALAAAHVSYTQSLRNIGIALRRYAEAEVLIESSLSTSDKTPSQFSYPSPSPSHLADVSDSPLHNESPHSPPVSTLNYMQSGGTATMTVRFNPISHSYVDEEFPMPLPPPPLPESGSSWDYFDPGDDENDSFRFVGNNGDDMNFEEVRGWKKFGGKGVDPPVENAKVGFDHEGTSNPEMDGKNSATSKKLVSGNNNSVQSKVSNLGGNIETSNIGGNNTHRNGVVQNLTGKSELEESSSKRAERDVCGAEREDPSEYITHRAKDFLSSIKDIEHRFLRASESGKEVSRMLEANKIRVGYSEAKGRSSAWTSLTALQLVCCQRKDSFALYEFPQHGTKVITWKRTTSSRSSSSRNPLATGSKDDVNDSESDFAEDFCMIAGSHSSTLDRLYAWERKLYDEVKASESIRKDYDHKCEQLKHMFAKDYSTHVIDKTRAVVKDLHSRIRIALHSVDSIAKRIEKMRDEELYPQLAELSQGLIRMWKAMLECHHAQYITISLAYHSKVSMGTSHTQGDVRREIMDQLVQEVECFGLSFANWINTHTSYVEALNGWLQSCILQPRERRSRRAFSPRRAIAPPIFVLCRDWSSGIRELPSADLSNAVRIFLTDLQLLMNQQAELQKRVVDSKSGESEDKDDDNGGDSPSTLSSIRTSLIKVLNRLTKFSEASLKMYEDIRQKSEAAQISYSNGRRY